ncbi:hypothetical protein E2542_SST10538 [Spatholobus suberectus]|nr:hypothetical protein E2542_SST10538 [Spatholobus suberectus]
MSSPQHEVKSTSFYQSKDESTRSEEMHDYGTNRFPYLSPSSSSCLVSNDMDQDVEVMMYAVATVAEIKVASIDRFDNERMRRHEMNPNDNQNLVIQAVQTYRWYGHNFAGRNRK